MAPNSVRLFARLEGVGTRHTRHHRDREGDNIFLTEIWTSSRQL